MKMQDGMGTESWTEGYKRFARIKQDKSKIIGLKQLKKSWTEG
jgi:hypothetical protein